MADLMTIDRLTKERDDARAEAAKLVAALEEAEIKAEDVRLRDSEWDWTNEMRKRHASADGHCPCEGDSAHYLGCPRMLRVEVERLTAENEKLWRYHDSVEGALV